MKWIKKNLTYNTLFLILTLFWFQNSYSQFTAYSTQGTPSDPDCIAILTGTEIWGGMGVTSVAQCVNAQISITNYFLVPYGPGWFGDTQGELYWYDGTKWKQPFNTTCGGGGGCTPPLADTIYVSTTGDDIAGTGSQTCPYVSLTQAITSASAGKIIKLETGSYTVSTAINLGTANDFLLTIVGGSSNAGATIIRGGGSNRLIYGNSSAHSGAGEAWTWKNLTIRSFTATATGSGGDGAAFRITNADGWTFDNVIFYGNGSTASNVDGGVFYLLNIGSTTTSEYWNFNNCIFDGNYVTSSGEDGGALRLYNSYVNFSKCIFRNNKADDFGGAVYLNTKGIAKFYDCLFYKNWTETDDGGAVASLGGSTPYQYTYFINCTFSQNTAGAGTTYSTTNSVLGAKGGGFYCNNSNNYNYFYNTLLYGNDGYSNDREDISRGSGYFYFYNSCIGSVNANGQGASNGNISTSSPYNNLTENTDPLFNNVGADDYSLVVNSPAKNKGSNSTIQGMTPTNTDLAGNPRSAPYDIGSYEYQDPPGPPTWVGGTNSDWTEATNWENNVVPTGNSDVIIGSGSNVPAVTTNVNINSLTIETGSSLTIANTSGSGTQFIVSKNLTVNGTLAVTGDVPLHLTGGGLLFGEYGDISCGASSSTTNMNLKISGFYNIASDINMRDLEIKGTLKGQTYTLGINGDWEVTSSGTFTAGTGKVTFNGNTPQNVTTKGQNFNNVEINNSNNPISINVIDGMILGINGVLKLTDGVIKTVGTAPFAKVVIKNNEPNAIVGSDGTPHNLSPSSYVWGNLKRHTKPSGYSGKQKYEFPIGIVPPGGGSSARYYRTRVDFKGLQGVSNITARFVVGNHPAYTSETDFANEEYEIPYTDSTAAFTLARMLGEGYWRIHPNQQPSSGSYDIVLFTGVFDGQGTSGKTAPVKTDTSNSAVNGWTVAGNLASDNSSNRQNSHGKIKSYNLTSFSDFGIGDGGGAALPIELLTFTVTMEVDKVVITWTTATEINNDFFTVERTLDGINFEEVLEMPGSGNSFEPLIYNGYDEYPLPGTSYYRLKQTDYDGQFEYSGMVELYNPYISNVDFYVVKKIGDNLKVTYNLIKEVKYKILIYDMMGKIISEEKLNGDLGINEHLIDISDYAAGTYFVTLTNPYEVYSENIFISR